MAAKEKKISRIEKKSKETFLTRFSLDKIISVKYQTLSLLLLILLIFLLFYSPIYFGGKTFQSGDRVPDVRLDFHNVQFLYGDGDNFYFMDNETFDQPGIPAKLVGEIAGYLKEGMECKLTFYGDEPIDIEVPTTVDLKVVTAEVAVRGDTATGVTKKVKVETGIEVQVPNFVKEGDTIRVDTRTGEYVTRV